jgi:hypothetical protein
VALAKALRHNSTLTSLSLRGAQLHGEGASAVALALCDNRTVKSLDLSQNRVSQAALKDLARALRLNASLTSLKAENWRDTFEGEGAIAALAASLATNKGLKELSLAGSVLGTGGARLLAPALGANATLTALDLSAPEQAAKELRIGDAGLAALFGVLGSQNVGLRSLTVKGNSMGPEAAERLGGTLALNSTLRSLDCTGCELTSGHVACIMRGVAANSGLTTLALGGASLTEISAARCVADALAVSASLVALDLSFCTLPKDTDISQACWGVLAQGVARSASLATLNLSYSGLTEGGATALAAAAGVSPSLTSLDLSGFPAAKARGIFRDALAINAALATLKCTGNEYDTENVAVTGRLGSAPGSGAPSRPLSRIGSGARLETVGKAPLLAAAPQRSS